MYSDNKCDNGEAENRLMVLPPSESTSNVEIDISHDDDDDDDDDDDIEIINDSDLPPIYLSDDEDEITPIVNEVSSKLS